MSPFFIFALLLVIVSYALSWHDEPAHQPFNKKEKP